MSKDKKNNRLRRATGSQPTLFSCAESDALASLSLALLGELVVLKDRLDANERLLQAHGLHGPSDVDDFRCDASATAERSAYRQAIYDRVLGAGLHKLVPERLQEQHEYEATLKMVDRAPSNSKGT